MAGASTIQFFFATAEIFITELPKLPFSIFKPPVAEKAFSKVVNTFSSPEEVGPSLQINSPSFKNGSFV